MVRTPPRIHDIGTHLPVFFCACAMMLLCAQTATAEETHSALPPNDVAACEQSGHGNAAGVPLTVEVRDQFGPYRSNQVTMVSDGNGMPLLTLACDGALSVFHLFPGTYRVQSFIGDVSSAEVAVNVPSGGKRIGLMLKRPPNMPVSSTAMD